MHTYTRQGEGEPAPLDSRLGDRSRAGKSPCCGGRRCGALLVRRCQHHHQRATMHPPNHTTHTNTRTADLSARVRRRLSGCDSTSQGNFLGTTQYMVSKSIIIIFLIPFSEPLMLIVVAEEPSSFFRPLNYSIYTRSTVVHVRI